MDRGIGQSLRALIPQQEDARRTVRVDEVGVAQVNPRINDADDRARPANRRRAEVRDVCVNFRHAEVEFLIERSRSLDPPDACHLLDGRETAQRDFAADDHAGAGRLRPHYHPEFREGCQRRLVVAALIPQAHHDLDHR
jgi:hypothetical protein